MAKILREYIESWADLYYHDELSVRILKCPLPNSSNKLSLTALWFVDGLHGIAISYPQDATELLCYKLTSSDFVLSFLSLLMIAQMSFPLFYGTYCPWTESMHPHRNNYSSDLRTIFSALDLIFLLIYFADIFATLRITQSRRKRHSKDIWLMLRICCCALFFIWSLVNAVTGSPLDFARCLAPIILISRRKSLRLIMLGVIRAARKCLPVFLFLFTLILFWSFLGFLIFRNVDNADVDRFSTFTDSLRTCMMSFTAAQYHVFAANPFIELNYLASFYFVILVMTSCVLTAPIIISVGNREYRKYSDIVFRRQLANRKEAIIAIHEVLAMLSAQRHCEARADGAATIDNRHSLVSRDIWLSFCYALKTKYPVNSLVIHMLFDMELERQFADTDDCDPTSMQGITCESLFRMCALLDTRFNVDAGALGSIYSLTDEEMHDNAVGSGLDAGGRSESIWKEWSYTVDASPARPPPAAVILARHSSSRVFDDDMSANAFSNPMHTPTVQSKSQPTDIAAQKSGGGKSAEAEWMRWQQQLWHSLILCVEMTFLRLRAHLKKLRISVQGIVAIKVHVKPISVILPVGCSWYVIDIIDGAFLFILAAFLLQVSNLSHSGRGWFVVGYILLCWFWVKMLLQAVSTGFHKYVKATLGVPVIVNVLSLIFTVMVEVEMDTSGRDLLSPAFICLMIVHCSRLVAVFSFLSETTHVRAVAPLFFRVIFIIFCCIYMFGVFAHNRFCNMLRVEEAAGNDDVAPRWIPFEHQLNFDTFARSLYTMFEIATYGDWSVVQVVAQVSPAASYFFFYTYRFLMTLTILPILSSFIIQAFVTRSDSTQKYLKAEGADDDDDEDEDEIITERNTAVAAKRPSRQRSYRSSKKLSLSSIQCRKVEAGQGADNGTVVELPKITSAVCPPVQAHPTTERRGPIAKSFQSIDEEPSDNDDGAIDNAKGDDYGRVSEEVPAEAGTTQRASPLSDKICSAEDMSLTQLQFEASDPEYATEPRNVMNSAHGQVAKSDMPSAAPAHSRQKSIHMRRSSLVGVKASPSDALGSSMISFWSSSGTERLENKGGASHSKKPSDPVDAVEALQKQVLILQEDLKLQRVIADTLNEELREAKSVITLLQGNLPLHD